MILFDGSLTGLASSIGSVLIAALLVSESIGLEEWRIKAIQNGTDDQRKQKKAVDA